MAEVTGSFGDQPIELNNAATEVTQKQLLAAVLAMASAQKLDSKAQKELEKELKKLTDSAKKFKKAQDEAAKAAEEVKKADEEKAKAAEKTSEALKTATSSIEKLASTVGSVAIGMSNMLDGLSQVGNSMTAAAGAMSAIPVVGGVLAAVFGAVASAADRSTKSFQSAAAVGATFNGSIVEFKNSATTAGMTMEDFGKLIAENGESLRLLGGTTDGGAKRFSRLSNSVLRTSSDLYALGYSTSDLNEGLLNYTKYLGQTGKLGQQNDAQLIAGSKAYLKEMDLLAKVTGETRKQQEDARAQLLADAQYQAKIASMGEVPAQALANTINSLSPSLRGIAKDIIVTGTATTEESKNFASFMPRSTELMQKFARITEQGGTITQAQQEELRNLMSQEGEERKRQLQSVGKYNQEYAQSYMQVVDASNMQRDALKKAEEQQRAAADGTDKLNQQVEQFKQQLSGFSNEFLMALAQSGALDDLMVTFRKLAGFTTDFILPAFNFMTDNIWAIIGTMVALKAINTAVAIAQLAQIPALAAMAVAVWAVVAPLLPFVAAVGAVLGVFYLLKKAGWSVGDVFEAIKDNVYGFGLILTETALKFAKFIAKFFGGSDMVDTALEKVQAERAELKEREAARDQRRNERREEAAAKDAEVGATNKLVDAKKQEIDVTKKSTETTVDYGDTISILKDQQQKMTQPGATTAAPGAGPTAAFKGSQKEFYDKMYSTLLASAQKQGVANPEAVARLGASQASLETGYGKHAPGHNYFGIKGKGSTQQTKEFINGKWVTINDSFRGYGSMEESADDYIKFLQTNKRYKGVLAAKTAEEAIAAQGKTGYATDPNYAQKLASINARAGTTTPAGPAPMQVASVTPSAPLTEMDVIRKMQEKHKAEESKVGAPKPTTPTMPTAPTQESAESLLASLNTKMDQLVALNRSSLSVIQRQLTAQQAQSGNLLASVG